MLFANLLTNNILDLDEVEFMGTLYSKTVLTVGNQKVEINKGVMQGINYILCSTNVDNVEQCSYKLHSLSRQCSDKLHSLSRQCRIYVVTVLQ